MLRSIALVILSLLMIFVFMDDVHAQISIAAVNTPYLQDFNSMASSGTNSVMPAGWVFFETGSGSNGTYTASNGILTTIDTYSFGPNANTDRALGEISGVPSTLFGASFVNNTGASISTLLIQYTGEQWRLGTSGLNDKIDFQYSRDATALNNGTWINVDQLDFAAPVNTGTIGALDGNAYPNRTFIGMVVALAPVLAAGATIWIRWVPVDQSGNDHGLAIDDFSISANPVADYNLTTAGASMSLTDLAGNGEAININQNSSNLEFYVQGRTCSINSSGVFAFPLGGSIGTYTSFTVNAELGNDIINVNSFTTSLPNLTINGNEGNDIVNFLGDISVGSGSALNVDLQDDEAVPGSDHIIIAPSVNIVLVTSASAVFKASEYMSMGSLSSIETANGAVTIEMNQQATPTSGTFSGLTLNNALISSSGSGTVTIKGKGGDSGAAQYGITLISGADIIGGTSGTLTLQGTGGPTSGLLSYGVNCVGAGTTISTIGANINIVAQGGGTGGSSGNYGLYVNSGATIIAGGSGTVTVQGTGGSTSGGTNHGVVLNAGNAKISSSGGAVNITGTGICTGSSSDAYGVSMISGEISSGGAGSLTIFGTGGNGLNNNWGIRMQTGIINSGGGNVLIEAHGGGLGAGATNYGMYMLSSSSVSAGGTGTVHITAYGGGVTGNSNHGFHMTGSGSLVTSSGGNIFIEGVGGGSATSGNPQFGVYILSGADVTGTGSADITIVGGTSNVSNGGSCIGVGIYNVGTVIAATNGSLTIEGHGGGSGSGSFNYGILLANGSQTIASGAGGLYLEGYSGGTSGSENYAVYITGTSTTASTVSADLSIYGESNGTGNSSFGEGVKISNDAVVTGGSPGVVNITGYGGFGTGNNNAGVEISGLTPNFSAGVTSTGGNVFINGFGGGNAAGISHHGIFFAYGGFAAAGGSGNVVLNGTGGNGASANHGIYLTDNSSKVYTAGGDVFITGIEGAGTGTYGCSIQNTGTINTATSGGKISIAANSLNIQGNISAANTDSVIIAQRTNNVAIELNTTADASGGPLRIAETELDLITAGTLVIGNDNSGSIYNQQDITRIASTKMRFVSGNYIYLNSGIINSNGGNITVDHGPGSYFLWPESTPTDFSCGTLSFASGSNLGIQINGTTPGTQYKQLTVLGSINLNNVSLVLSGTHVPSAGQVFTIVDNDGTDAIVGTFAGLAQGATIPAFLGSSYPATISYTGGTGNDVVITVASPNYIITNNGTTVTIADVAGLAETLSIDQNGSNMRIQMAGRTFSLNGAAVTGFPYEFSPTNITSVTINTGASNDVITLSTLTFNVPSLNLSTGIGNDGIQVNADLTFKPNANFIVNLQDDDPNPGTDYLYLNSNSDIVLSGTGFIDFKVSHYIGLYANSSLTTQNGNITLEANLQPVSTTGNFFGFNMSDGFIKSTGSGNISITAKGGTGFSLMTGIYISSSAEITGSISGTTTLTGTGGLATNVGKGLVVTGAGTLVSSLGGNVIVNGTGGATGTSSDNAGVSVENGGSISAGGTGTVTVNGTGASGATGPYNEGVVIKDANSKITSSGGNITINGQGGSGNAQLGIGIRMSFGGGIEAVGNGNIILNGTGGLSPQSSNSGVSIGNSGTHISTQGGDLTIHGIGGGITSSQLNEGVEIIAGASVSVGAGGDLDMNGNAGLPGGVYAMGVFIQNATITVLNGNANIIGQGGHGGTSGNCNGISIDGPSTLTVSGIGIINLEGHGGLSSGYYSQGINIGTTGTILSTQNGHIDLLGTGGGSGSTGFNYGVHVTFGAMVHAGGTGHLNVTGTGGANTIGQSGGVMIEIANAGILTDNGNITVIGNVQAGNAADNNVGVGIRYGSLISAGGVGSVYVEGHGGIATGAYNHGVQLTYSNAKIISAGGQVHVIGYGGGTGISIWNAGIWLESDAMIQAGGNGLTWVEGFGGNPNGAANYGIELRTNSTISSSGGNVQVNGLGGGIGSATYQNVGVEVADGSKITAGGLGNVTVTGNGGPNGASGHGVAVNNSNAQISSSGGNILVTGTGGGNPVSDYGSVGVIVQNGGAILGMGNGTVTINGTGGLETQFGSSGVVVWVSGSRVASEGGDILVQGSGGGMANSFFNTGVYISETGRVDGGDNADIQIIGDGGVNAGGNNYGVLFGTDASVITTNGNLLVKGKEGPGPAGLGIGMGILDTIQTLISGNIEMMGNSMQLGGVIRTPMANQVYLHPYHPAIEINLGLDTNVVNGPLSLADFELDSISTGTLIIGQTTSGAVTISDTMTRPTNTYIEIHSNENILFDGGLINTAGGNLYLDAGAIPDGIFPYTTGTDVIANQLLIDDELSFQINGTIVDVDYEQLNINGSVNLIGVSLLMTGSYVPTGGEVFILINNDLNDPVTGVFTGLAEGDTIHNFLGTMMNATISYVGGTGNDVVITAAPLCPITNATIHQESSGSCFYTDNIFSPQAALIPGATYQWNFGANAIPATATGYGPHTVYYTAGGMKSVKLVIATTAPFQCTDSSTLSVTITNCPAQILGYVKSQTGLPITNVTVRLYTDNNADGLADNGTFIRSVVTAATGGYVMASLIPGNYVIVETQPAGWLSHADGDNSPDGDVVANIDSLDNLIPVSIVINKVDSMNIFIERPTPGSITGNVFYDIDGDQFPDPGEGISGVTIKLLPDADANGVADNGIPVATLVTDPGGSFIFTSAPIGNYVIVETQPPGYISIKDIDVTDDGDLVPNTNMMNDTLPVTLINSEIDAQNYFIEAATCSHVVTNANDDGLGSLRQIIGCLVNGDTISFSPSLAGQTIVINSAVIQTNKQLTILSAANPKITIASQVNGLLNLLPGANLKFSNLNFIGGLPAGTATAFENAGILKLVDVFIYKHPSYPSSGNLIVTHPGGQVFIEGTCRLQTN